MIVTLTIIRYKKRFIPLALLAMAIHRLPLWLNRDISFFKLMGSGKNGTFDKKPDWQQWAVMAVHQGEEPARIPALPDLYGRFMYRWWVALGCETLSFLLHPIEGHGMWDGKAPFGQLPKQSEYEGRIAVLTRATIRLSKLGRFWQHVAPVASRMANADGFITSFGIGEIPWIKQATFSIWRSKADMKAFAYQMKEHAEVVRKTHQEKWYSEDMFVRFKILDSHGQLSNQPGLNVKS
jgi:hypothetical protein